MTASSTTALATRVAANPIGLTVGKRRANATETKQAAKGSRDGFEGLATGSRSGKSFGQFVKAGWFHVTSVLSGYSDVSTCEKNNVKGQHEVGQRDVKRDCTDGVLHKVYLSSRQNASHITTT